MSDTTWNKRAASLLRNLNAYRHAIPCIKELMLASEGEAAAELAERLRRTERTVACVESALQILTDEDRFILDKMFIHAGECPVDDLCEACICEKSSVYRMRKRALDRFTLSLYGDCDS